MEYYKFNNGQLIPKIGLGTAASDNLKNVIKQAYYIGYRHFDTAQKYANEKSIGEALAELFKEGVKREELFITTKVYPFKENDIVEKLKQSLKDLQIDYIDLVSQPKLDENNEFVLTHKPVHTSWKEMEECQNLKLAKSIGVSNFNVQSLMNLLSFCKLSADIYNNQLGQIKPQVNQIEFHPYLNQNALLDFCKKMKIHVTAFSPLARQDTLRQLGPKANLLQDQLILKLAKKYSKTPAQIALRYLFGKYQNKILLSLNFQEKGISMIPKTEKIERLKENFDVFWKEKFEEEEMNELEQLNQNLRTVDSRQIFQKKIHVVYRFIDSFHHLALFS